MNFELCVWTRLVLLHTVHLTSQSFLFCFFPSSITFFSPQLSIQLTKKYINRKTWYTYFQNMEILFFLYSICLSCLMMNLKQFLRAFCFCLLLMRNRHEEEWVSQQTGYTLSTGLSQSKSYNYHQRNLIYIFQFHYNIRKLTVSKTSILIWCSLEFWLKYFIFSVDFYMYQIMLSN